MDTSCTPIEHAAIYELHFRSLFEDGRGLAFPCNAAGHVNMDTLSDSVRNDYLFARAVVGYAFAVPAVKLVVAA